MDFLEQVRIANVKAQKQQEKNTLILGQMMAKSLAQLVVLKKDEKNADQPALPEPQGGGWGTPGTPTSIGADGRGGGASVASASQIGPGGGELQ